MGTLNQTIVDAPTVFKAALLANAAALICLHCHPSGDPTPSAEDIKLTRTLIQAGQILGIGVLDHVILGGTGRFQSIRESGVVDFAA